MNALHGKCHTLEERLPSGARFPLICMFVFRSAPALLCARRCDPVFCVLSSFCSTLVRGVDSLYARLLFGLLLPYAQSFQRVAYSAARACFPMCALDPGVDLWWSRSVIAYFWARSCHPVCALVICLTLWSGHRPVIYCRMIGALGEAHSTVRACSLLCALIFVFDSWLVFAR